MRRENNSRVMACFLIFFLGASPVLYATDVLERTISVRLEGVPLKEALAEIAKRGGFEWSYNAGIVDENRRVSLVAEGWTVREALLFILGDDYTFNQYGEYLILKKRKKDQKRLSGYISDRKTGQRMANVTVYDRQTLRSTTTDRNGFYELPVTTRSQIVVSKLRYRDTLLQVSSQTPRLVKFDLYTDTVPQNSGITLREGMNRLGVRLEEFWVSSSQKLLTLNVRDSLRRVMQFSVLPGLSTNGRLGGSVANALSLNLLAGYSRGNQIAELAGLCNINRERVSGIQGAGLFNITGQRLAGFQAAGLFNNLSGNATGVQMAGVYNLTAGSMGGAQLAGVLNIAGFGRRATFQAASGFNWVSKGRSGVQLAGVGNHSNHATGFQGATIVNSADTLRGCQVSGFLNRAGSVQGVQIGIVNIAREIKGVQLGLINISKTGGYVTLEASANDVFYANLSFKMGVPAFYTILSAGFDPESPENNRLWGYGLGLGAYARLTRWSGISFDLVSKHLSSGAHASAWQEWVQFAISPEIRLGNHFSLAGGPSANLFVADPVRSDAVAIREQIVTRDLLDVSNNADGRLSAWWGWTGAVRVRF